jgi:hypothetical protein
MTIIHITKTTNMPLYLRQCKDYREDECDDAHHTHLRQEDLEFEGNLGYNSEILSQ